VRYAQKQTKRAFLDNMTTVLPLSGRVGHPTVSLVRSAVGTSLVPSVQKLPKWQDRGIIPVST
jgi:hypothetical protein